MLILVAGPCHSGTNDNPALLQANVDAMLEASPAIFKLGQISVLDEWLALLLIAHAGSN